MNGVLQWECTAILCEERGSSAPAEQSPVGRQCGRSCGRVCACLRGEGSVGVWGRARPAYLRSLSQLVAGDAFQVDDVDRDFTSRPVILPARAQSQKKSKRQRCQWQKRAAKRARKKAGRAFQPFPGGLKTYARKTSPEVSCAMHRTSVYVLLPSLGASLILASEPPFGAPALYLLR